MATKAGNVRRIKTPKLDAAVYVRSDIQRGGSGVSAEQQEADCRGLAAAHSWNVVEVYADHDATAYARSQRAGYEQMLSDVRSGKIQAIAVWHVDTLVRRNPELEPLIALCDEHGVRLATVTGEIDLATDGGRSFARQLGAFARVEAEHRADRLGSRNKAAADAGEAWKAGSRCYGYELDGVTIIPDEAAVIREVAARLMRGESLRQVAQQLNADGRETARGKEWHPTALKRLMVNPRLIGKRAYKGKLTDGEWPSILTPQVFTQVAAVIEERSTAFTRRATASPRRYLLTGGLLVCGLCGNALSSQPSASNKRGYVCRNGAGERGCGKIRIAAEPVEIEAAERVLTRLGSPSVRRRIAASLHTSEDFDGDRIVDQITAEEGRLAELGQDYADRKIGRVEFHAARDRMQERIDDLRVNAAGAAHIRSLPGVDPTSLAQWWLDADLTRRRDMVSLVLDHIVVGKATRRGPVGLDDDRLSWVWRTS